MGWNGSGVVVRQTPVATGTVAWADTKAAGDVNITTGDHDYHDQNLADAITNCMAKDGQNAATANLNMGGFKLTNGAAGTAAADFVTFIQLTRGSTPVGTTTNAAMSIAAASATATFTADVVIVGAALTGNTTRRPNYSQTLNLGTVGAGGMDTGSPPISGYVAIYAIWNSSTSADSILASDITSATAPAVYSQGHLPAGYDNSALLSVWPTNGAGNLVAGNQINRTIKTAARTAISTSTQQASLTTLSISGSVPKNAKFTSGNVLISSTASADILAQLASNSTTGLSSFNTVTTKLNVPFKDLMLSTPQSLSYVATVSTGTMNFIVNIYDYTI